MRIVLLFLCCITSVGLRAQFLEPGSSAPKLSLDVAFGPFAERGQVEDVFPVQTETDVPIAKKSPYLAAALSLVLPGLGEYYVGEQIWRGMIFTALDAGLWYGHLNYLGRGEDSTAAFEAYADQYWLPSRYADTLNWFLDRAQIGMHILDTSNFAEINRAEDTLSIFIQGFPLSHRLPKRGSQQYYELISKYLQFAHGWVDHQQGGPSPYYLRHAEMRKNMNYQYEVADYFLFGLILNRVLSAVDAVLLTKDHNSAIRVQGELRTMPSIWGGSEFVPTAKLRYRF